MLALRVRFGLLPLADGVALAYVTSGPRVIWATLISLEG